MVTDGNNKIKLLGVNTCACVFSDGRKGSGESGEGGVSREGDRWGRGGPEVGEEGK